MKPLQSLKNTIDRFGEHALGMSKRLHAIGKCALKSPEQRPVPSNLKIEIKRDICPQPAVSPNHPHQQSFPRFVEFPAEIRLLIWHFASTTGRVVELQWSSYNIGFRNCSAPRPPAVLQTCRDSRQEALKVFQPYFSMEGRRRPIYIDPINDVMFFRIPLGYYNWEWLRIWMFAPDRPWRMELFREELKGIRRVAFLWGDLQQHHVPIAVDPLWLLQDLEEFIVLWADWSVRTFEGRGVNFVEGVSSCVHHERNDVSHMLNNLSEWEERLGLGQTLWDQVGCRRPSLTLRHWCLRDEEK